MSTPSHQKHRFPQLSPTMKTSQLFTTEDVVIKDEELDQLRQKNQNSYQLYADCLKAKPETPSKDQNDNTMTIRSHKSLYDLDLELQKKVYDTILDRFKKNSLLKDLELYPVTVYETLKKKLGVKSSGDFTKKMLKHFKKHLAILEDQQNFLFKNAVDFYSRYDDQEQLAQYQSLFETYDREIGSKKIVYRDICSRISQSLPEEKVEIPDISLKMDSKLLFTQDKQDQPPPQKLLKILDYKMFLNDKLRKYKMTRSVKKFREIVKHFPIGMLTKLYPASEKDSKRRSTLKVETSSREKQINFSNQDEPSKFTEYRHIVDLATLKTKLVSLCRSMGLNYDINIEDGAFLLFKVDNYYKEEYTRQQKLLRFVENSDQEEDKDPRKSYRDEGSALNKGNKKDERVRYLQKTTWLEEFVDYDEIKASQKLGVPIYNDKSDSLLKFWFEFVQIADVKNSLIKIEFKLNKLKETFTDKKIFQEKIFYEFMRAYIKLLIIKSRDSIIKIYDSLNFFRSVEKMCYIKKYEMHALQKNEFVEGVYRAFENVMQESSATKDKKSKETSKNDKTFSKEDYFTLNITKCLQEDKKVFNKNSIDIYSADGKLVVYDVVKSDFELITQQMLRTGAHFIDSERVKKTSIYSSDLRQEDFDRESFLIDLLESEANYQFSKAKYLSHIVEIFRHNSVFKHSMSISRYLQETIAKRPQFGLFKQSLSLSYSEETDYYECLEELASDILSQQKIYEEESDEFQQQVFSQQEILEMKNLQKQVFRADFSAPSYRNKSTLFLEEPPEFIDEEMNDKFESKEYKTPGVFERIPPIKPYESLVGIFYALMELEIAIESGAQKVSKEENDLKSLFQVRKLILAEALEVWDQIKYKQTPASSIKDYYTLECDVLLDIPDSSYNLLKMYETKKSGDKSLKSPAAKEGNVSSLDVPLKKSSEQLDNSRAGHKNPSMTEEEYLRNFISFIRIKEVVLLSLLSSAYQSKIYYHQINLFGKDQVFKDTYLKSEELKENLLSLLLNLDYIQFRFEVKDLGDCKLILLDPSKLNDLWTISEYFILHESLLQNALQLNYYYILDVANYFSDDILSFFKAIKSPTSQNVFFNIVERKNNYFVQAKVNPALIIGKLATNEKTDVKAKMESIIEYMRHMKKHIFHDALRIQTVEVSHLLRNFVLKLGLDEAKLFKLLVIYAEEKSLDHFEFSDAGTLSSQKGQKQTSQIDEDYFDDAGRWRDPFTIPSTKDLLNIDFEQQSKQSLKDSEVKTPEPEKKPDISSINLVQKISHALGGVATLKKSKEKSNYKRRWYTNRPDLFFLKDCRIMYILEWCNYLFQILTFETFESCMQSNSFDYIVLHGGDSASRQAYKRNEVRVKKGFEVNLIWLQDFKRNIEKLLKGQKVGQTREAAHKLFRQALKHKFQIVLLACLRSAKEFRKREDLESLKMIRRFLIKVVFNTLNHFYQFGNKLYFHEYYNSIQVRRGSDPENISFKDSPAVQLVDFVFLAPFLKPEIKGSLCFYDFAWRYNMVHQDILNELFLLKNSTKAVISTLMTEIRLLTEQEMINKNINSDDNIVQFIKGINTICKGNIKAILMQEALLCLNENTRPFTMIGENKVFHLSQNVLFHYEKARKKYDENKKSSDPKERKLERKKIETETIEGLQLDPQKTKLLINVLSNEIEKKFLEQGTEYYVKSVEKIKQSSTSIIPEAIKGPPTEENIKEKILGQMNHFRFLPFIVGFTTKILDKSLFIQAHKLGDCIVTPVSSLEHDLHELNKGVVEYFEKIEEDIQRKYIGKISLLESQVNNMTKKYNSVKYELDWAYEDHKRSLEAQVAEASSKLVFQVDILKKKMKNVHEEQEFVIGEAKEKIRQEFKDKIIEDEIALKQIKNRFHEYKEGMSYDIREFIQNEKNMGLRAIFDKRNQAFLTSQEPRRREGQEDEEVSKTYFEEKDVKEDHTITKLYSLLQKTRALYRLKEVMIKERYENKLNEMNKKLLENQNLLYKLNDLQNNEANLKEDLTGVKKELVIMEKQNNILRKSLHKNSQEKVRLVRKDASMKVDCSEMQSKFEDILKRKTIVIPVPENVVGFSSHRQNYFSSGAYSSRNGPADTSTFENIQKLQEEDTNRKYATERKRTDSPLKVSTKKRRPMTSSNPSSPQKIDDYFSLKSAKQRNTLKDEVQQNPHNKHRKVKSFVEVKFTNDPKLFGLNIKSRNMKANKGFLMKKFVHAEEK